MNNIFLFVHKSGDSLVSSVRVAMADLLNCDPIRYHHLLLKSDIALLPGSYFNKSMPTIRRDFSIISLHSIKFK